MRTAITLVAIALGAVLVVTLRDRPEASSLRASAHPPTTEARESVELTAPAVRAATSGEQRSPALRSIDPRTPSERTRSFVAERPGATASLHVRVTAGDAAIPAVVRFLDGPNAERVLEGDATDLYPGFCRVSIVPAGNPPVEREVLLRHRKHTELALDVTHYRPFFGRVTDADGRPLAGAVVAIDGRELAADEDGGFRADVLSAGEFFLLVEEPGFAAFRQRLSARAGASASDPYRVQLSAGCRLELDLDALGGPLAEAQIHLVPLRGQNLTPGTAQPSFPWYRLQPLRALPGGRLVIEDLPPGIVDVHAFHSRAHGRAARVSLDPARPASARVEWTAVPLLEGEVLVDGLPVRGALVSLEARNPMRAQAAAVGVAFLSSQPLALLPSAFQQSASDAVGGFALGWWPDVGPRVLTVRAPDGEVLATRVLARDEGPLTIEL